MVSSRNVVAAAEHRSDRDTIGTAAHGCSGTAIWVSHDGGFPGRSGLDAR